MALSKAAKDKLKTTGKAFFIALAGAAVEYFTGSFGDLLSLF